MIKWIGKLKWWGREEPTSQGKVTIIYYGQYFYKPVLLRAISEVVGISKEEMVAWVNNPDISVYLNDDLITGPQWGQRRLESGQYEIKIPSQSKIWRFHIA